MTRLVSAALAIALAIDGLGLLGDPESSLEVLGRWQLAANLPIVVGGIEIFTAALLVFDRARFMGAACAFFVFVAAIVTHFVWGITAWIALPLVLAAASVWLFLVDRPQSLGTSYPEKSITEDGVMV